jgi:hypothetical protein
VVPKIIVTDLVLENNCDIFDVNGAYNSKV